MSESLTNEEIRAQLLKYNQNCGPVTDTTREIHLKKLEALKAKSGVVDGDSDAKITDGELRSQLISHGQSVGPITATTRHMYIKRLQKIKNAENSNRTDDTDVYYEPMDID